jgi:integrase
MLTELKIRKLKSAGEQLEIADGAGVRGLTLRVNQAGAKTFWLTFRAPGTGKPARLRLGAYDPEHFSLAKAREIGREHRALIDRGIDPRQHLREQAELRRREAEQAAIAERERRANCYAAVVEDYIQKFQVGKKQNRRWRETRRLLLVQGAAWHDWPVADISRRHIHRLLDAIIAAGKPYSANRTYAALRTFFRWCSSREIVAQDPMLGIERPFDGEAPRDRAWSDDEVVAVWRAAGAIGGNAGAALKLLILLGQRRDEVFHLVWTEIEADETLWRLTTQRSKSKREHVFPLSGAARRLIQAQPRSAECAYVFPTRTGNPIQNWTALRNRVRKLSGVADFTFHCARHTFRTALDRFGIPPHVKNECLNHARQGVGDRHYSHHDYLDEQREGFERWAKHIEGLVGARTSSRSGADDCFLRKGSSEGR